MLTATRPTRPGSPGDQLTVESSRPQIRVLVVDDHPAVRQGLLQLLEDQPDFTVVGMSASGEQGVAEASRETVDVAVVDYQLGGRNGLWVSRKLKRLPRPPKVLLYSAYANDHLAACCLVAQADGLLHKGGLGSELCDGIRAVGRGMRLLPKVRQPLAATLCRRLDDSEQPIFAMLLAGMDRPAIKRVLAMSGGELAARETSLLAKLEPLPGEVDLADRARDRFTLERASTQPSPRAVQR